jgi:hypothetical protein
LNSAPLPHRRRPPMLIPERNFPLQLAEVSTMSGQIRVPPQLYIFEFVVYCLKFHKYPIELLSKMKKGLDKDNDKNVSLERIHYNMCCSVVIDVKELTVVYHQQSKRSMENRL